MTDEALRGLEQAVKGLYSRYRFTPEIMKAIEEGLVVDADPTWEYQDVDASIKAGLTEAGRAVAREAGWLVPCRCSTCVLEATAGDRQGYCPFCDASGRQYGFTDDGTCRFHTIIKTGSMLTHNQERP